MLRQQRRKIKRVWDKISCFSDCTDGIATVVLPNTAWEFFIKVSEDLLLCYNLDMFRRWRLYPFVVVDGFFFRGLCFDVGVASVWWCDEHFGEDEDDEELV